MHVLKNWHPLKIGHLEMELIRSPIIIVLILQFLSEV